MDSKRPCNEVTQTQKELVVYIFTCPAYVLLKTFIASLLTFRYLWFGVHFVYDVGECSNVILIFFVLVSLLRSSILSLTNVYCQDQGRNVPFSWRLLNQCLSSFWQWQFWGLWGDSLLWFRFAFLIFCSIDVFSCDFFSRAGSCYFSMQLPVTWPCFKFFSDDHP